MSNNKANPRPEYYLREDIMKILYKITIALVILQNMSFAQSSSWKIWITPETSVFNKNENYYLVIGLTGYGQLKPSNIKMVVHANPDVKIKAENMSEYFDTIIMPFTQNAPDNIFTEQDEELIKHGIESELFLQVDVASPFKKLIFQPISSGDKHIDFFATYSSDGINWTTTHYKYSFHVNTWYENNEILIVIFTIVFGISALLANSYMLYSPIKSYFCKVKTRKNTIDSGKRKKKQR